MNKNSTRRFFFLFISLFAIACIFSTSCRRNKDCDLVINVESGTTGGPIPGAIVVVHPSAQSKGTLQSQSQSGTTDGAGAARFTFKLPALLEVVITPPSGYTPPSPPYPLVKLEEGRSVAKTIKIY